MTRIKSTGRGAQRKKVRFHENMSAVTGHELTSSDDDDETLEKSRDTERTKNTRTKRQQKDCSSSDCDSSSDHPHNRDHLPGTLDRVHQTYNKLRVKLKEVQSKLKQNPMEGRLKLTLFVIALYSQNTDLMKPFPRFLMKSNKPDIDRTKQLMNNMPDLNLIQTYSRYEFYTNYLSIQFLHWLTVEMTSRTLVQVSHEAMVQIFQKINPVRHIIKPDIILKLNAGSSRTIYSKKLVYIVVNTNQIHRMVHYGPESLLERHQSTICATNNAFVYLKMIEKPEQSQVECSDIDYITILIAELTLDRTTDVFHSRLSSQDLTYVVSNPKLLNIKYLLFYKLGTYDAYKRLVQHKKRRVAKEIQKVEEEDIQMILFLFAISFVAMCLILTFFPT